MYIIVILNIVFIIIKFRVFLMVKDFINNNYIYPFQFINI